MTTETNENLAYAPMPRPKTPFHQEISIGKDILELVSGAMYVDPKVLFREYIQNSVDAIDEAVAKGVLESASEGAVQIVVDSGSRTLTIRDNGIGISNSECISTLTAFGNSHKRGTTERGFRGVGRLAGFGYCRELVFRTRSAETERVQTLTWDALKFREILRNQDYQGDLEQVIKDVVTLKTEPGDEFPLHFFEVQLFAVARTKGDELMDSAAIQSYLEQVAPLPFHPRFSYGQIIEESLAKHDALTSYRITLADANTPTNETVLYRPYRNTLPISDTASDSVKNIETFELTGLDGNIAAVCWIAELGYHGAIKQKEKIRGIRARVGNIQIGTEDLFSDLFAQPRFNSWSIGEVYVFKDSNVTPNGRRDNFEYNARYSTLTDQIEAIAKTISRKCHENSASRNKKKKVELAVAKLETKADVLSETYGSAMLGRDKLNEIQAMAIALDEQIGMLVSDTDRRKQLARKVKKSRALIQKNINAKRRAAEKIFDQIPKRKADAYREIMNIVYDKTQNKEHANALVREIVLLLKSKYG